MRYLGIEAMRNGRTEYECPESMTVGDLIRILEEIDPELPIYLNHDYKMYGSVNRVDMYIGDETGYLEGV